MESRVKYGQRGYDGFSMSTRATSAYENGEKPLSKWTTADRDEINALLERFGVDRKLTLKELKNILQWHCATSWHHTSKMVNRTQFYHPLVWLFTWEAFENEHGDLVFPAISDVTPEYIQQIDPQLVDMPRHRIDGAIRTGLLK